MTSEKKESIVTRKDVVTTLGAVGVGAVTALGVNPASAPGVLALAAALAAVFPPLLGALTEAGVRRMQPRYRHFFDELIANCARGTNMTPQEVAEQLEKEKEDPAVADAIWRAVRGLMEAPNDAAAVPLGVLTAEYLRDKQPPDVFFRGVVRLLQELEAAELRELRQLLNWVLTETKREKVNLVALPGIVVAERDEFVGDPGAEENPSKRVSTTVVSSTERLFSLLIANSLGVAYPGFRFGEGVPELTLRRGTVERLLRVLGKS